MNYIDIFRKSFLDGYASTNLTVKSILVCMMVTILVSAYILRYTADQPQCVL